MVRYLGVPDVLALHQEIMARHEQEALLRDNGEAALEGALFRPQMAAHYAGADIAMQAALLILGIAQAHPFVDGNKRIALAVGTVFLQLNGYLVKSLPGEFGMRIVEAISQSGRTDDALDSFAGWIRSRL